MTVTTCLLLLWATLVLARGTPIGMAMRRLLVDWPARRLARVTRGQIVFAFLLILGAGALIWLLEGEAVRMLGAATPEIIGWASTFEITTLLDLFTATLLAGSSLRLRNFAATMRTILARKGRRHARTRLRVRRPTASNDDEDGGPLRLAA